MSRTYSNFILFEDVIDNLPEGAVVMNQAVDLLLNPIVKIVEEDCGTLLGKMAETSPELQGFIESATKEHLSMTRINELLAAGQYKTGIRTLHTCQSYKLGGVCRMCYKSSFLGRTTNTPIGSSLKVPSMLVYQSDVIMGNGYLTEFPLSQTSDDWYLVEVVKQGVLQEEGADYTLTDNTIIFPTAPGIDPENDVYTVHFFKQNSDPFLGYIGRSYTGALLGMLPLPTLETFLREKLYEDIFSDSFVSLVLDEVHRHKAIPSTYKDYMDRIHGKMEKVLLALYLYAIYGNVEV